MLFRSRLQGWARQGYLSFNALYQRVAHDRLRRANFENELMAQLPAASTEPSSESEAEEEEEEIFPANDLEGVVAPMGPMVTPGRTNVGLEDDPYNPPY